MANKIDVKLILQLHESGTGRNAIANTRHIGRSSVSEVIAIAKERGIRYADVVELSDEDAYKLFYPDKFQTAVLYADPDYSYVHAELKRVGVTLKLLWNEYCDKCLQDQTIPMGYTRFCEGYSKYTSLNSLTNHLYHQPGNTMELDWSGPTMQFLDEASGKLVTVYLFVGCLSYSRYTYVEPTLDMKMDAWINCNVHMLEFIGGVPRITICDNLKTGVVSHPKEGDVILTETYEEFGEHYRTAILPADVRKPKQKAAAEGSVGNTATEVIGALRNTTFSSFQQLKDAVAERVKIYNDTPFQKREGSRTLVFAEEKEYLAKLPDIGFEISTWDRGHKAGLDFHVVYKTNRYSVPYQFAKRKLDYRITGTRIEIFSGDKRIACHALFPEYVRYKNSTLKEHMPPEFQREPWDDIRIKSWASTIGTNTSAVIDRIFESCQIKEQGYRPSLSILKLSKAYSPERLETACELALTKYRAPRYRHLKALLQANQDILWQQSKEQKKQQDSNTGKGYLRGSAYYGGGRNDR